MNPVGYLQKRMDGAPDFDTILDVCEHKHRRIVLAILADQQQSISIDDLTNAIAEHNHQTPAGAADATVTRIRTKLHHVHLPKLAEAGFIEYDPERQVVEPTAQVGQEESHLSVVLAVDSELPTT